MHAKRRPEHRKLDPEYPYYSLHPESKQTIIAKCLIGDKKISRVSYIPCQVDKQGHPEILKYDERGRQIFDYMEKITRDADLNARCEWDGDEVLIHSDED